MAFRFGVPIRRLARAAGALALALAAAAAGAQGVTVFAAASLTNAFEEIAQAYRAQGGSPVKFSFAASSTLAKQIESGASADIFAAADEQWMDYLAGRKLIEPATRSSRLGNTLVLITPASGRRPVDIKPGFDLAGMIGNGKLVTGDPAHVPVGRYAQQALTKLGVWDAVAPKIARTDNVRAALLLVERGEAPFGIVYGTDAAASGKVDVAGAFPADSHPPVSYPFAIVAKRNRPEVKRFFEFLYGPEAQAAYRRAGFSFR
ncbi:MAG TPA: molybdate ABC transporter substrate-binding protein [Burkholderiales bacterium]|nr:molybdate ABC transporter substrate-binding protein [Burkholderiales bacterium]